MEPVRCEALDFLLKLEDWPWGIAIFITNGGGYLGKIKYCLYNYYSIQDGAHQLCLLVYNPIQI
jgi:hypothetical protein